MSAGGSPARQLLMLVEDEASIANMPIAEVIDELAALGVDPATAIARARKRSGAPAGQRRPAPPPVRPPKPEVAELPAEMAKASYKEAEPGPDLMADVGVRASVAPEIDEGKRRGGGLWIVAGLFVAAAAAAYGAMTIWPEFTDFDRIAALAGLQTDQPAAPGTVEVPAEAETAIEVSRLEPVPPPVPAPTAVVTRPEPEPVQAPPPSPTPSPQPVEPAPKAQPQPEPQTVLPTESGAPINIVPRVEPPPVQESRLPADVARPFTAPPSIVAVVPVERELLAEAGTGILSSGSRRTAEETRLAGRVEDAERIAAGRAIAALVTMRSAEESYDAVILQRPRVEEDRTIADADPALIPILGDTAHLFDLVRLAPR
jgi:outer membrane biosynthesis protein TonB